MPQPRLVTCRGRDKIPYFLSCLVEFISSHQQETYSQVSASSLEQITRDILQGTELGPLCILMLTNNVLTDTALCWRYLDDSTIDIPVNTKAMDFKYSLFQGEQCLLTIPRQW